MHPNQLANLEVGQWKPGQSGNPSGGRAHDPVRRALKKITVEVGVAQALFDAAKSGDWQILNSVVERIVGKVPVRLDQNVNHGGSLSHDLARMTPEEKQAEIAELEKLLGIAGK